MIFNERVRGKKIFVSFSGGRTSAYMGKLILDNYPDNEKVFIFANTGQEHEETYKFLDRCDQEWNLDLVWLEGIVHHNQRKGSTHKRVSYATASHNGDLFEEMVKKYGICNVSFPHCTRELKLNPMISYIKNELGWKKGEFVTALGIRSDEMDRVNPRFKELGLWYPFVDMEISKKIVNSWWKAQPFKLNIPENYGNCTWCYKKTTRKLLTNIVENPDMFEVPLYLEEFYGLAGASGQKQVFFRKNLSTQDLIRMSKEPFNTFEDIDYTDGCAESCEVFSDTMTEDDDWFDL